MTESQRRATCTGPQSGHNIPTGTAHFDRTGTTCLDNQEGIPCRIPVEFPTSYSVRLPRSRSLLDMTESQHRATCTDPRSGHNSPTGIVRFGRMCTSCPGSRAGIPYHIQAGSPTSCSARLPYIPCRCSSCGRYSTGVCRGGGLGGSTRSNTGCPADTPPCLAGPARTQSRSRGGAAKGRNAGPRCTSCRPGRQGNRRTGLEEMASPCRPWQRGHRSWNDTGSHGRMSTYWESPEGIPCRTVTMLEKCHRIDRPGTGYRLGRP